MLAYGVVAHTLLDSRMARITSPNKGRSRCETGHASTLGLKGLSAEPEPARATARHPGSTPGRSNRGEKWAKETTARVSPSCEDGPGGARSPALAAVDRMTE